MKFWQVLILVIVAGLGGYFVGYTVSDTTAYIRTGKIWDSRPRPIKYVDTCASYQPKN